MEEFEEKKGAWQKFKRFWVECKRVLVVTKKPTNFEFKTIVKVTGLGILVIGFIGFLTELLRLMIGGLF